MLKTNRKPHPRGVDISDMRRPLRVLDGRCSLTNSTTRRMKVPVEQICRSRSASRVTTTQNYERQLNTLAPVREPEKAAALQSTDTSDVAEKQRDFLVLQKSLIQLQDTYIKLYAQIRDLEQNAGVELGDSIGEVRLLSVKGWPAQDLLLLVRDDADIFKQGDVKGVIGPEILQQLHSQLSAIPAEFSKMGTELLDERLKVLEYFRSKWSSRNTNANSVDWRTKNAEFDSESKRLEQLVTGRADTLNTKVVHCIHIAKISWIDRENLINQLKCLQQVVYERGPETVLKHEKLLADQQKLVEELRREHSVRISQSGMVSSSDAMLKAGRARSVALENQLSQARAQLDAMKRRLEKLTIFNHRRESCHEARTKKLEQVSKTGEETIQLLTRQREALETRIRELQEQAAVMRKEAEARESELKDYISVLKSKLEKQERLRKTAEAKVDEMENRLNDIQDQCNTLREHSQELVTLQRQKCLDFLPSKEPQPSEKELEIWSELQKTKSALDRVREELEHSRADKDGLLESLARIARDGPENKMAEELLRKERTITSMRRTIEEQKEKENNMSQSVLRYEGELDALRMENNLLRNYASYNMDVPQEKLKSEMLNLSLRVKKLSEERAALVSVAASHALMLERHERCAELFAKTTRVRRQLAAQLEGRSELSLHHEGPNSEVSFLSSLTKSDLACLGSTSFVIQSSRQL